MAKHRLTTVLLVLVFFAGLGLLLYPPISNWYNVHHSSRIISSYLDEVAELDDENYAQLMLDAQAFNKKVNKLHEYALSPEMMEEYNSVLDVSGLGIMGYVDIPKLNVSIPIYHGTSEGVLQIAVGHLEWSSLPIGGESTHCVLSGHRGLPAAKLLTDLPEMEKGDLFYLRVLNELLTYEVDQILTVEPQDVKDLKIVPGKDYCTLVTCTPYGINSHRLLVRGHRIANAEDVRVITVSADAVQIESLIVAPFIALPVLLFLLVILLVNSRKRFDDEEDDKRNSNETN